jgi:hypothetical protein
MHNLLLKKTVRLLFLFFVQMSLTQSLLAQKEKVTNPVADSTEEYYTDNFLRYDNHTYKKTIHSVQLINKAADMSSPMIRFGSDDQLKLGFDDLSGGFNTYTFTVIHCNADWKPSDLAFNEYVNGFTENPINEYSYSTGNTTQKYTHYNLYFPNENLIILKSGNYIIKVYENNNPDALVLTRRFMVYEEGLVPETSFRMGSSLTDGLSKQGINMDLKYSGYDIRNPYDIKVFIMQNERWDNAVTGLKPTFMRDRELVYESSDEEGEFNGGVEFRNFDIKTIRSRSEHLEKISTDDGKVNVYLTPDDIRARQRYSQVADIDGNYLVKIQEGTISEVEADYCYVHFFLNYPIPETNGNVYILGGLTDWQCNSNSKMKYNYERRGYECTLFLKQGYYNYEYVILSDGSNVADESLIEGSHHETENEYTVFVYYRIPAMNYDKLIGVKRINSSRN